MSFWKIFCTGALVLFCACTAQPAGTPTPQSAQGTPDAPVTAAASTAVLPPASNGPLVFVGTYTFGPGRQHREEGIFAYRMDPATGGLTLLSKAGGPPNPSFLTIDPTGRYLVAVSEWGQPGVGVSSYAIDRASGALTFINAQAVGGESPAYVTVHPSGKWVLTANYMGGSLTVLPLGEDGKLDKYTALVQHSGSGPNKERQEGPHAHSVMLAPGSDLVLAADLGIDKVMLYDFDTQKGLLNPHAVPALETEPGSGPRHMAFSPDHRSFYVLNELASTLLAYLFDAAAQAFTEIQSVALLPADFKEFNKSADVHLTPDGKFLYATNRGHDSLAIFSVDPATGKLNLVGHQSTQGQTPRNFAIDSTGTFLLVANQDSGTIVSFRIDSNTGELSPTGQVTEIAVPMCIQFLE